MKSARLGRVLIGEKGMRGKGCGAAMISEAIAFAFREIDLSEITLAVFDFNSSAIACYKELGFPEYEIKKDACRFENEDWSLIMMRLDRKDWASKREKCRQGHAR